MKKALPVMTCLTLAFAAGQLSAQISTDATLGREPRELEGPNYSIGSELGRIRGQNLFHSFERFSLVTGESATFSGPDAIRNVISRVTGGERSDIDGTVASTIDGADFYFINPAGVLFGPNASLDVTGSFHVSTADQLNFEGGEVFSATNPAASSFSVAAPEAFGFLDHGAGRITLHQARLPVAADRTLSLVGGDILIDRGLIALRDPVAHNGNATLVAMSTPGTVAVADGDTSAAPQGEISITDGAINVSSEAGGGVVRIRAGTLEISGFNPDVFSGVFADNLAGEAGIATALIDIEAERIGLDFANISTSASGAGDAGDVTVRADALTVQNEAFLGSATEGRGDAGDVIVSTSQLTVLDLALLSSDTSGAGDAGEVSVRADALTIQNGASLGSTTEGLGNAGDVTVSTHQLSILVDGSLSSDTVAQGNAGDVTVSARELEIADGGLISSSTFAAGEGGSIEVNADRLAIHTGEDFTTGITSSVELEQGAAPGLATGDAGTVSVEADEVTIRDRGIIGSNSADAGDAGRVQIAADRITVLAGGQIGSGTGLGSTGTAGSVVVTATESITIEGQSRSVDQDTGDPFPSGIFVSAESTSPDAGDAGTATVMAPLITIANRGEIASETFNPASGGTLVVSADHLVIDDGEITTQATNAGDGGQIEVTADVIELRNGGLISARSTGSGNAGSLTIRAPDQLVLDDRSEISTSAQQAGGGGITIEVDRLIDLRKSSISSSVAQESGDAGDITIDPDFLILDDSSILARVVAGRGGDISIVADNLVLSPDSLINAEALDAEEGIDGTVVTSEPAVDLASALVVLAAPPLDADALLREPCAVRRDVGASSFTGAGRGGLPAAPDRPLGSAYRPAAEAGVTSVQPAGLTLAISCSGAE